jgi:hypothetical protein
VKPARWDDDHGAVAEVTAGLPEQRLLEPSSGALEEGDR